MQAQSATERSLTSLKRLVARRLRGLADLEQDSSEIHSTRDRIALLRRRRVITDNFADGLETFLAWRGSHARLTRNQPRREQLENGQFFLALLSATARAQRLKRN
jgi:hypothetical protein